MERGERLTNKQKRFIEEFCVDFNAAAAAVRAGYSGKAAKEIGYENLTKPHISAAVSERLRQLSMGAEEAFKRLSDIGRGSFEKFLRITDGNIEIDLTGPDAKENLHLIKKIKQTKRSIVVNGSSVETTTFEIELHDSKDALKMLLEMNWKMYEWEQKNKGLDGEDIVIKIEA